jgi:LuxR family transcriptional regulator, maltose regulon positive regulatory protein
MPSLAPVRTVEAALSCADACRVEEATVMELATVAAVAADHPELPLITAKVSAEVLPAHVVARPRPLAPLLRRGWRIASITAGPGLGKSVLLRQMLATLQPDGYAVVALDDADNAPERFWRYVVGSLDRSRPGAFAGSVRAWGSSCTSEVLVAHLLEDATALDREFVLAIEDLHTIRNRSILTAVTQLLEHLPSTFRVVFTSRQDLALPTGRWRARSWLVDVREADLAFTNDEAALLFEALDEVRLDADEIARLTEVTEGWVSALQLAALAMRDSDPHEVVEGFFGGQRMIVDFVGTEIIDRQTKNMRDFMTAISVADSLDPDLCNLLSGREDSGERLKALAASMHFLVEVDDARASYRYHHLLRDVLRSELARQDPERCRNLHRLVAEVFERRGELAASAVHLVRAGDYDRAFGLVFGSAYDLWERGDVETVRAKLDVFPIEYIDASPHRMVVYAYALALCSSFDESREWMERAQKALDHEVAAHPDDLVMLDALRVLTFTIDGRDDENVERGRRVLLQVEAGSDIGPLGHGLRQQLVAAELLVGDAEGARATLSASAEGGSAAQTVRTLGLSARIARREGWLDAAAEDARRACTAAGAFGIPGHVVTIDAHLATLGVLLDRNSVAATGEPLEAIHQLLDRYPAFTYRVLTQLEEVRIARALHGIDAALEALGELRYLVNAEESSPLGDRVTALEARLRIDGDETRRGRLLVERLPQRSPDRRLLDARLLLATDRPIEACRAIGQADFVHYRDRVEAQLIMVRGAVAAGTDLEHEIHRLVDLAAPERFVRAVLDEGPVVARLVRRCAESAESADGDRLAVDLGAPSRHVSAPSELVIPLSGRERDVLRFLPSRLTTKEIAAECFMSANTVKAHLKKIYGKLGVGTRAEAVERARLLGELRG